MPNPMQMAGQPEHQGLYRKPNVVMNAVDFTYHHILPRAALTAFWNKLVERGKHTHPETKLYYRALFEHHQSRLNASKGGSYVADVGKTGLAGSAPVGTQGFEGADGEFKYEELLGGDIPFTTAWSWVIGNAEPEEADRLEEMKTLFYWFGGNIHLGPSTRYKPTDGLHQWWRDDAGEEFELSALILASNYPGASVRRVMQLKPFIALRTAYDSIIQFLGGSYQAGNQTVPRVSYKTAVGLPGSGYVAASGKDAFLVALRCLTYVVVYGAQEAIPLSKYHWKSPGLLAKSSGTKYVFRADCMTKKDTIAPWLNTQVTRLTQHLTMDRHEAAGKDLWSHSKHFESAQSFWGDHVAYSDYTLAVGAYFDGFDVETF